METIICHLTKSSKMLIWVTFLSAFAVETNAGWNNVQLGTPLYDMCRFDSNNLFAAGGSGMGLEYNITNHSYKWVPMGTSKKLASVYFLDCQHGWAVGDNGTIVVTNGGPEGWVSKTSGTVNNLLDVFFVSASIGYAVGGYGTILKTINGGESWELMKTDIASYITSVSFIDSLTGWIVGDFGLIAKTIDGGLNWSVQHGPCCSVPHLSSVQALSKNMVLASGSDGIIKTIDGGQTWVQKSTNTTVPLNNIALGGSKVWATGDSGVCIKSNDNGETWIKVPTTSFLSLSSIVLFDSLNVAILQNKGTILSSLTNNISWASVEVSMTDHLLDGQFVTKDTGWAVGWNGTIIKSIDGGITWKRQTCPISSAIKCLYFINSKIGWVGGGNGQICRTDNGGTTWQEQKSNSTLFLPDIFFADSNFGWAVGMAGQILRTSNGGNLWVPCNSGISTSLGSTHFVDRLNGWAVGGSTLLTTTDGGITWVPSSFGGSDFLSSVYFVNTKCGWILGNTSYKTTDGGNTWQTMPQKGGYAIFFLDTMHGWISQGYGQSSKTTDGGQSWGLQKTNTNGQLMSICFLDTNTGWAFGFPYPPDDGATIIRTTDGGGPVKISRAAGSGYSNKKTIFKITLSRNKCFISCDQTDINAIHFSINNLAGKTIKDQSFSNLKSTSSGFIIDISGISPGSYIAVLKTDHFIESRKVIINR